MAKAQIDHADLVIRGARLIDGTGGPSVQGDIAVTDDRIAGFGELSQVKGAVDMKAGGTTSALYFREERLDRLDRSRLVLLAQIHVKPHAFCLPAEEPSLLGEFVIDTEDLVGPYRLGKALQRQGTPLLGRYRVLDQRIRLVSKENAARLGMGLQARRKVHFIADDRIVHSIFASKVADSAVSGAYPHT